MTREEVLKEVLNLKSNNILLELATGFGKSRLAIEKIKSLKVTNILLVVNRIVHKQNWLDEINKWWPNNNLKITMTTYVSLPKHAGKYDAAIYDECHHLSERCREALCSFDIKYSILLSATVNAKLKDELVEIFDNLIIYKKNLRTAIEDNILPDPRVFLLPLELNNELPSEVIWKNPKAKGKLVESSYATRWQYLKQKTNPVKIYCTEKQYNDDIDRQISYWKDRYFRTRNEIFKNKWLWLCSSRLKWLSDKKLQYVMKLLLKLDKYRTLVFCNSIEQTELLGKYCINSKNKSSLYNLLQFNEHKINHITACNILNEGMNLVDCQIGIYANLNSSEIIIQQRTGRLLRHKNPVIIILYFKNTREEELVNKMIENYNPQLITTINNLNDVKI